MTVIDSRRRDAVPTGKVIVAHTEGHTDREVADLAGFSSRHFGYTVTRYDDGSALVALWND